MFIDKPDFNSSIHSEIVDLITRSTDTTLEENVQQAIDEMAGYLSARYDTDAIFAATGDNRNKLLAMLCKDITLYHLHAVGNPNQMPDLRVKRYDDAINTLKRIQKGEVNPPGLPLIETETSAFVKYGFNDKRNNHF